MQCKKFFLCVGAGLLLTACTTAKFDGTAVLAGNVCDENGRPVPDYLVSLDLFKRTYTNPSGIFVFRDVKAGNYTVRGKGMEYEKIKKNFRFYDRKGFVHLEVKKKKSQKTDEVEKEVRLNE